MRLIEERELIRRISELPDLRTINTGTIGKIIKECKTLDAEPVRHGRWNHIGGDEWRCSQCGDVIHTKGSWEAHTKKFCSECGAKMDSEGM